MLLRRRLERVLIEMEQIELIPDKVVPRFPRVNYIGNKEKISPWIVDNFPIKHGIVLDVFSGGGSVSYELKRRGFTVYSNDILYSSYVVNKALIENNNVNLERSTISSALSKKLDPECRNKLEWLSNNLFYPDEVDELSKLVKYSGDLVGFNKYIFLSLIRRSMIRKLPYSRMNIDWNNIIKLRDEEYSYRKYGRKRAYHNFSFSKHMYKELENFNNAIFDNKKANKAFNMDALELLNSIPSVDLIYLDPPYPNTMNNYDGFYGSFDRIFGKKQLHTDYTRVESFLEELKKLVQLATLKTKFLVLSLNSKTIPTSKEIADMLGKFGEVDIISKKHNYQVSGKKSKHENHEIVIILKIQ